MKVGKRTLHPKEKSLVGRRGDESNVGENPASQRRRPSRTGVRGVMVISKPRNQDRRGRVEVRRYVHGEVGTHIRNSSQ